MRKIRHHWCDATARGASSGTAPGRGCPRHTYRCRTVATTGCDKQHRHLPRGERCGATAVLCAVHGVSWYV